MADIFDVIADGTRRDILALLRDRAGAPEYDGTSVSQIVSELGISQPTVSKHLKVLREAELVVVREEGQHRFYSLDVQPLESVEDWLMPFVDGDVSYEDVFTQLPDGAAHAAEILGRAAASVTNVVSKAFKRPAGR